MALRPILKLHYDQSEAAQRAMEAIYGQQIDYPGVNTFADGLDYIYFEYDDRGWLNCLIWALIDANIPFQVEYCEEGQPGWFGFSGQRVQF